MSREPRTDGGSTSNARTNHRYGTSADEGFGGAILASPVWLLLSCSGVLSTGLGAAIVFVPALVGVTITIAPNPADALGVAIVLVMTGAGLLSGGLVAGLLYVGQILSERSRRRRAEKACRERDRNQPR